MAEQIYYVESDSTVRQLTVSGTYKYLSGSGVYEWAAEPTIDHIPHSIDVHRHYKQGSRGIALRFVVEGSSYTNVQSRLRALLNYFMPDIDDNETGTLRIVTDAARTFEIEVAPQTPEISKVWNRGAQLTLNFVAPLPYWSETPAGSADGTFNGATPVNVAYDNTGDVQSWPTFTITGVVDTPTITYPSGHALQVGTAMAGTADVMTIYTQPGDLRIDYEAGGTAAVVNYTGYGGTASYFDKLATGAGTIVLTATSGTAATFGAVWPVYRIGIV